MKKQPGTTFRNLDLHVHTPASSDFLQRETTAKQIVGSAVRKKLDAIAITDHTTIAWVESVRSAAKGHDLTVFPGFELNANGGHLLAIFDPSTYLNNFLDRKQ
jgi:predicted metal-dependent phosphoesterase TrpH